MLLCIGVCERTRRDVERSIGKHACTRIIELLSWFFCTSIDDQWESVVVCKKRKHACTRIIELLSWVFLPSIDVQLESVVVCKKGKERKDVRTYYVKTCMKKI